MTDKAKPTIDIKRPGSAWKKEAVWFLGLAVLLAAIVGYAAYWKKNKSSEDPPQAAFMKNQGLDPDFFKSTQPPPKKAPEPVVEASLIKMDLTEPAPKPVIPKASNLFKLNSRPIESSLTKQINNQRRGAVAVNVKNLKPDFKNKSTIKEIGQGKWKEPKTKSSLPLDMSRVIPVDRFIPAILVNEINSELGGKVVAQIEGNVFGGHGRKILIPAGSKAVGRYKPLKKVGDERISILWTRILTPDGINIHVGNAEMADAMGRSGITGEIDRRYTERYGMSLLVSLVTAATTYSVPVTNQNQQLVVESFGKEQSGLAKTILEEHLEIKPRIEVAAGSRILISASKDIWFKDVGDKNIKILPVGGKNEK